MITPTMSGDGMRYWRLRPDARLKPWIHCYWFVEPALSRPAELPDLLIPDGHSELVFRLDGGFTRWKLGDATAGEHLSHSYVIGGRSRSVLTHSPGGLRLAGVKLEPRALRALLRMPLTDFRDNTVSFRDLGWTPLLELEEQVAGLHSVDELPALFDGFFLRTLDDPLRDDATTDALLARIRATHGAQPILAWAREHRVDTRTLQRRFLARMGMTPKQYARIERFKRSYLQLTDRLQPGLAKRRAHLEGFYDESHFDREFRWFMGTTPMARLRQEARFTTTIGDHLLEG